VTHMVNFCMFICYSPTWQVQCQGNSEVGFFQEAIVHDTNNIGQYMLGLQIDSSDRNHYVQLRKSDTKTENYRHNNER
jgi:hypothetical protein